MKTRNYIYCLTALLIGTACSNTEDMLPTVQDGKNEIQFAATLQEVTAVNSRANGETNVLRYVNDIRIRKIDINGTDNQLYKETQIFNVRPANYGTLDMDTTKRTKTAMEWTDKENNVDFYAWTVPTGVSIGNDEATGTVDFGIEAGNKGPDTTNDWPKTDKYDDKNVTPLEVFISAYKQAKFTESPSVNLGFRHVVSKVSIIVRWWTNRVITDDVTITFPAINQKWNVVQTEENGQQKAFTVTDPVEKSAALSFPLNQLYKPKDNYRTFYLPPLTEGYNFENAGDFEVKYGKDTYYGSLSQIVQNSLKELKAGEHLTLEIHLNPNFNAGGTAYIHPWKDIDNDNAYANPYRGIYTLEGLKVLKSCLAGTINSLPDSLYIEGTANLSGKKIIRLYNDLKLTDEEWSLALEDDMIFDGLGHTITVPAGRSLFGEITGKAGIEINNIRLAGEGQLAASLKNVSVYNCHANGTGNLVGTANNGTTFDFCSAEAASSLLAGTTSGTVTIKNCFVAYDGATKLAGAGENVTAQNSFFFNTATKTGTYYDGSSTEKTIKVDDQTGEKVDGPTGEEVDDQTGQLVISTPSDGSTQTEKLIDHLNEVSNTQNGTQQKYWVYVYGKIYPVMRIK